MSSQTPLASFWVTWPKQMSCHGAARGVHGAGQRHDRVCVAGSLLATCPGDSRPDIGTSRKSCSAVPRVDTAPHDQGPEWPEGLGTQSARRGPWCVCGRLAFLSGWRATTREGSPRAVSPAWLQCEGERSQGQVHTAGNRPGGIAAYRRDGAGGDKGTNGRTASSGSSDQ